MADVGKCFQLNKKFKLEMYINNKIVPKTLKLLNTLFFRIRNLQCQSQRAKNEL